MLVTLIPIPNKTYINPFKFREKKFKGTIVIEVEINKSIA